ncbi:MAG: hypothetical protein P8168_14665 [Deltaproteobacteria bacterium]|jgi:hypothetical protein
MYNPSPFLICAAALTSVFSFFFGSYFTEREVAYRMWIRMIAYNARETSEDYDHRDHCPDQLPGNALY